MLKVKVPTRMLVGAEINIPYNYQRLAESCFRSFWPSNIVERSRTSRSVSKRRRKDPESVHALPAGR